MFFAFTDKRCLHQPISLLIRCSDLCDSCTACEKQPDGGEMARLLATLEECLEALCILLDTQGRSLAAPVAAGVSRSGQGAATVRYHCVNAECLGILGILEQEPEAGPSPLHPASGRPKYTLHSKL